MDHGALAGVGLDVPVAQLIARSGPHARGDLAGAEGAAALGQVQSHGLVGSGAVRPGTVHHPEGDGGAALLGLEAVGIGCIAANGAGGGVGLLLPAHGHAGLAVLHLGDLALGEGTLAVAEAHIHIDGAGGAVGPHAAGAESEGLGGGGGVQLIAALQGEEEGLAVHRVLIAEDGAGEGDDGVVEVTAPGAAHAVQLEGEEAIHRDVVAHAVGLRFRHIPMGDVGVRVELDGIQRGAAHRQGADLGVVLQIQEEHIGVLDVDGLQGCQVLDALQDLDGAVGAVQGLDLRDLVGDQHAVLSPGQGLDDLQQVGVGEHIPGHIDAGEVLELVGVFGDLFGDAVGAGVHGRAPALVLKAGIGLDARGDLALGQGGGLAALVPGHLHIDGVAAAVGPGAVVIQLEFHNGRGAGAGFHLHTGVEGDLVRDLVVIGDHHAAALQLAAGKAAAHHIAGPAVVEVVGQIVDVLQVNDHGGPLAAVVDPLNVFVGVGRKVGAQQLAVAGIHALELGVPAQIQEHHIGALQIQLFQCGEVLDTGQVLGLKPGDTDLLDLGNLLGGEFPVLTAGQFGQILLEEMVGDIPLQIKGPSGGGKGLHRQQAQAHDQGHGQTQ